MRYRTPEIFRSYQHLIAIETTRHGGVSPEPYYSLNLGKNTLDLTENLERNRQLLCKDLGIDWSAVAYGTQVHGNKICVAKQGGRYDDFDAFITNVPNVAVAVSVADCTPILFFDPVNKVCGAAHAGWRGAAARIGSNTLQAMQQFFHTDPKHCLVYIGTCITQTHFEVGAEVADAFDSRFSVNGAVEGKFLLDLKAALKAELLEAGVPEEQIELSQHCTWDQNMDYFSHRREQGHTGRFLGLIGWFEPG